MLTFKFIGWRIAWYVDGEFVTYQADHRTMWEQYRAIKRVYPEAKLPLALMPVVA